MKNILLPAILLLCFAPLFGQVKTPGGMHDSKAGTKPATVNSAIKPMVAEVIQSIESKMVRVDAGSFTMGCTNEKDSCYFWEKPSHKVNVGSFFIGKFDVTQREWEAVVGTKPWFSKDCAECPVENVSWFDAQVFINTLNQLTGRYYRLPTEAEWEFAASGGNKTHGYKYAGSNNASAVAWFDSNSGKQTHVVGQKQPNELGLFDMSGNVWQWCSDWFDDKYYNVSPVDNPTGPANGPGHDFYRACRGGSWWSEMNNSRVANRDRYPPDGRDDDVGFRLARD